MKRKDVPSETEEAMLIERAKHDKDAFGLLYESYVERIYKYVYYRTGNVADAEDLTARIFERALNHIGSYQDRGLPFSAWLYRIAHNLVANYHRDRNRRTLVPLDDVSQWTMSDHGPEFAAQLLEDKEALRAAIGRLPADRQELLMLKYTERLSNAEIGEIMGRSEGAVKSLYHRTLLALREDLSDVGTKLPSKKRSIFSRPFGRK